MLSAKEIDVLKYKTKMRKGEIEIGRQSIILILHIQLQT